MKIFLGNIWSISGKLRNLSARTSAETT